MNIATRTPEGWPLRCPICGKISPLELLHPEGAALCPHCGCLFWYDRDPATGNYLLVSDPLEVFRSWFANRFGVSGDAIMRETVLLGELAADSLDYVELVMELEDRFNIQLSDLDVEQIKTVGDLIDYLRRRFLG